MKFIITGSGGCVSLPKPLCPCGVCAEARQKSGRYRRFGCSLYLEDLSLLVDTPEDISHALNAAEIKHIDRVFYTHRDPDHTLGMRVFEQLRLEWLDYYEKISPRSPIEVCAAPNVSQTLDCISIGYGPLLNYYEKMGLIKRNLITEPLEISGITVTAVAVEKNKSVSIFVFEENGRKLIYSPCDCKPFPMDKIFKNADCLIIGNTFVGDVLKNGRIIGEEHPLRKELHSIEDILKIKRYLSISRVVITHIQEDWGKSYDDYLDLEKKYSGIGFAYDGMVIEII